MAFVGCAMAYRVLVTGLLLGSLAMILGGSASPLWDAALNGTSVAVDLPPDASTLACRDSHKLRMGIASWYGGPVFHQTANGEPFQPYTLAAASRSLPFNTRVRVTNLRNGRSVVVRINDRGPYVPGRIIDLTPEAAARLDITEKGVAPVYIEIVRNDT